jgi:uncharacterized low-complexity protein
MTKKTSLKPAVAAVGFALVGSLAVVNLANAADNPFGASSMKGGYMQVAEAKQEGMGGMSGDKAKQQGMSGMSGMSGDKAKKEGKCGEGKCGADKAKMEGKCGGEKKPAEGKCGGAK